MAHGKILIDEDRCKGCELCIHACPQKILVSSSKINRKGFHAVEVSSPEKCTGCGFCYDTCPDVVIEVYQKRGPREKVERA